MTEALKREGFGVLTEIDVAETLKTKLGEDMPAYRILGVCNPTLVHMALKAEPDIGLLLPCNVIVREKEKGSICVGFIYPLAVLGMANSNAVKTLALEATNRLVRVKNELLGETAA